MAKLHITESNTDLVLYYIYYVLYIVLYKLHSEASVICKRFKNNYLKANCENVVQTDAGANKGKIRETVTLSNAD